MGTTTSDRLCPPSRARTANAQRPLARPLSCRRLACRFGAPASFSLFSRQARPCSSRALSWIGYVFSLAHSLLQAGPIVSFAAAAAAAQLSRPLLAVAAALVAAASLSSDIPQALAHCPAARFFCGNFGLIADVSHPSVAALDDPGLLLSRLCEVTQVRGGQAAVFAALFAAAPPAAGSATTAAARRDALVDEAARGAGEDLKAPRCLGAVRRRLVNTKRGDLPTSLLGLYARGVGRAAPIGSGTLSLIGHSRFATASLPSVHETHPHEWSPLGAPPPDGPACWTWDGAASSFARHEAPTVGVQLTHNGDCDGVHVLARSWL